MKSIMWATLAAAAVTYVIGAFVTLDRKSDSAQIKAMIRETVSSIQKRDLGGTISCLSKNYADSSGLNYDRLRMLTAQALRVEDEYTTKARIKNIGVNGDSATIDMHFSVASVASKKPMYERDLILHLTKEKARHAWIIPVKKWRVTEVDGLALESQESL